MLIGFFSFFMACQSSPDDSGNPEDTGIEEGIDCTADLRTSATITILDQEGDALPGVDVSYSVDGVEGAYVETIMDDGSYYVGGEESGDFVVQMYTEIPIENDPCCWDVGEGTLEFTIEADECHVISQTFETTLEWSIMCADADENGDCG